MKEKRIILILVMFTIIFTFFGGTLAYWSWNTSESEKTNVVFTLEQDFWCAADGGGDITDADAFIAPAVCTNSTHAIQRAVTVTPTIERDNLTINMELWLDIDSIDSGLSNSENFKYALTTNPNSCTEGVIATGNFYGLSAGNQAIILDKKYGDSTPQTYYLYIWLDAAETSTATMDQSFSLSISGQCNDVEAEKPQAPVLDEGMIPVTLLSDGTVTTIAPGDKDWYDYENKEWANVVLVNDESRSTYQDTYGVTVDQDDILAYYTWIPRYSYRIPTGTGEREIGITFESTASTMATGDAINTNRTHPAFWWDDDSDGVVDSGETVAGIWVGKFETTGTATIPTILPNKASLRSQNVSTQFATSQKFSASDNTYGLSNTNTNSHMMKNSEWGAVAYLSHSVYGINDEIRVNNTYGYKTGCGASTENASSTSSCEISYNSSSTPQSTTGNITGVFDMSGGAVEYVMGVLADDSGNPRSGNSSSWNSGFNGLLSDGTSYTSGTSFPASKYYNLYSGTSSMNSCNGGICYGHALSETANWYSDYAYFVNSGRPWFIRGGDNYGGVSVGAFNSTNLNGNSVSNGSWRSVLVVGYGV